VISHKREGFLNQIIEAFFNQYNELKEISEITITTAVNTSQEELVAIATKFKEELKLTNVKVNVLVDASILGGFIVNLGDKVYNASIKHKFNELRKELILN
jgi:F-type H+-transporting ATPase subunit delta